MSKVRFEKIGRVFEGIQKITLNKDNKIGIGAKWRGPLQAISRNVLQPIILGQVSVSEEIKTKALDLQEEINGKAFDLPKAKPIVEYKPRAKLTESSAVMDVDPDSPSVEIGPISHRPAVAVHKPESAIDDSVARGIEGLKRDGLVDAYEAPSPKPVPAPQPITDGTVVIPPAPLPAPATILLPSLDEIRNRTCSLDALLRARATGGSTSQLKSGIVKEAAKQAIREGIDNQKLKFEDILPALGHADQDIVLGAVKTIEDLNVALETVKINGISLSNKLKEIQKASSDIEMKRTIDRILEKYSKAMAAVSVPSFKHLRELECPVADLLRARATGNVAGAGGVSTANKKDMVADIIRERVNGGTLTIEALIEALDHPDKAIAGAARKAIINVNEKLKKQAEEAKEQAGEAEAAKQAARAAAAASKAEIDQMKAEPPAEAALPIPVEIDTESLQRYFGFILPNKLMGEASPIITEIDRNRGDLDKQGKIRSEVDAHKATGETLIEERKNSLKTLGRQVEEIRTAAETGLGKVRAAAGAEIAQTKEAAEAEREAIKANVEAKYQAEKYEIRAQASGEKEEIKTQYPERSDAWNGNQKETRLELLAQVDEEESASLTEIDRQIESELAGNKRMVELKRERDEKIAGVERERDEKIARLEKERDRNIDRLSRRRDAISKSLKDMEDSNEIFRRQIAVMDVTIGKLQAGLADLIARLSGIRDSALGEINAVGRLNALAKQLVGQYQEIASTFNQQLEAAKKK